MRRCAPALLVAIVLVACSAPKKETEAPRRPTTTLAPAPVPTPTPEPPAVVVIKGDKRPKNDAKQDPGTIESDATQVVSMPEAGLSFECRGGALPLRNEFDHDTKRFGVRRLHFVQVVLPESNRSYSAGWYDLPVNVRDSIEADALLEAFYFPAGPRGAVRVIDDRPVSLGKTLGREYVLDRGDGLIVRGRLFVVKSRIYEVMAFAPREDRVASEFDKVMASFKITTAEPPPPQKDGWRRSAPGEGGPSASFPAAVVVSDHDEASPFGTVRQRVLVCNVEVPKQLFLLEVAPIPAEGFRDRSPAQVLDVLAKARTDGAAKNGIRADSAKSITLGRSAGVELRLQFGESTVVISRLFVVGERMVAASFMGPGWSSDAAKFLDSLALQD